MKPQVPMIDVSANNHLGEEAIDWPAVYAAGYHAVMIKASEGATYDNPWLGQDSRGAIAAGLEVGYYHFAHPGLNSAITESDHFLKTVAGLHHDLGLGLDLEVQEREPWSALARWAKTFHVQVRQHADHSPLYVNDYFLENLPGAPWGARLWLAQTARPRRQVWAWQMTTAAKVPGIAVPTDVGFLHPE